MKDKKVNYGLTFNEKTLFVLKQMKDGMLLAFPQELPNCHFTFLFKGEKINIHHTDENKTGKNRYDNKNRFEINPNKTNLEIRKDFENIIMKHELPISKLPGRAYMGGYFQFLENEIPSESGGKYRLPIEDIWRKLYIIRKDQMTFYRGKIWIALDRGGGIKGKWHDIGIVFGPFNGRTFFLPYKAFKDIYSNLYPNLKINMSFISSRINFLLPFNDKVKNVLMRRGRKIVEGT